MSELGMTPQEIDTLGEIANISMGTSATALSALVNNLKVDITTPNIELIRKSDSLDDYQEVCTLVHINFVKGLSGSNVLILHDEDVLKITDLMLGGDGKNATGEVTEMHMSAVSEAMNQMMGSASTSLSMLLKRDVDISPPKTDNIDVESVKVFEKLFVSEEKDFVKIKFKLKIGDVTLDNVKYKSNDTVTYDLYTPVTLTINNSDIESIDSNNFVSISSEEYRKTFLFIRSVPTLRTIVHRAFPRKRTPEISVTLSSRKFGFKITGATSPPHIRPMTISKLFLCTFAEEAGPKDFRGSVLCVTGILPDRCFA